MKLYKNGSIFTFKLFLLVTALNINFVMFASSSARKIVAPAVQSGVRAMITEARATAPTILAPVNLTQNFQPMVTMPSQQNLNFNDGVFNNIPKASLFPQQFQASNSSGPGNNPFRAAILAGLAAMVGSQVAHADDESSFAKAMADKGDDVEELFVRNGLDPQSYPELVKFIKRYRCSFDLEMQVLFTRSLQGLSDYNLTKKSRGSREFRKSPSNHFTAMSGFFIKGSTIDRLINAERMKKVIEKNNLDYLKVADKCLAIKAGDINIVASEIKFGDQNQKISLNEVQQLYQLAMETGYTDWFCGNNVVRDSDGKLIFIDTEDGSYFHYTQHKNELIIALLSWGSNMDNDAVAWLEQENKTLKNRKENQENLIRLPMNSQYDTEIGIDFEAVKKEYKCLQDLEWANIDKVYRSELRLNPK